MAGVVTNLKRMFVKNSSDPLIDSFRQSHYLNALDPKTLREILLFAEQRFFMELSPQADNKQVLFVSAPVTKFLLERCAKMGPASLLNYELDPYIPPSFPQMFSVTGGLKPLAVRQNYFDMAFVPAAGFYKMDIASSIPQISASLLNGGRMILSVIHPSLELFLYNQNPASPHKAPNNFQNYFSVLKDNHLYLEGLLEGVIDRELKPFFTTPRGGDYFEELRGIPLVLFLRAVKFVKM